MVGVLVGLKLRLLRNQLQRGSQQVIGLVLLLALTVFGAGALALVIATGDFGTDGEAVLAVLVSGLTLLGWAVLPVAATGVDTVLDVGRLSLLPISWRRHGVGLLLASALSPGTVVTLLLLAGFLTHAPGVVAAVVAAAAIAVQATLGLLTGRIVVAALGGLLRRRRTRELAYSLGAIVTVALSLGGQWVARNTSRLERRHVEATAELSSWVPLNLGGRGLASALDGRVGIAVVELLGGAAVAALLVVLWWLLVRRELVTVGGPSTHRRRRSSTLAGARGPVSAVAFRELRYLWRHPIARTNLVTSVVLAGLVVVPTRSLDGGPASVLLACFLTGSVGLSALNMLATDGRAAWFDLVATDPATILRGKALARVAVAAVLVSLGTVLLATVGGAGWTYVAAVPPIAAGLLGVTLGVGVVASVTTPTPLPDIASGNPWAGSSPGQGCVTAIAAFALFLVSGIVSLPVAVGALVGARVGPVVLAAVCVFAPAYGWAGWRIGLALAERRMRGRIPELLAALSPA